MDIEIQEYQIIKIKQMNIYFLDNCVLYYHKLKMLYELWVIEWGGVYVNNNTSGNKIIGDENSIIFYNDKEENVNVEVVLENENVWLNIESVTKLFKIDRTGITRHINSIYKDKELEEESTCAKIAHVQKEGKRSVIRNISYYNLDMIISIGFRVNSKPAIKFRTWANKVIKEYISSMDKMLSKYLNENK